MIKQELVKVRLDILEVESNDLYHNADVEDNLDYLYLKVAELENNYKIAKYDETPPCDIIDFVAYRNRRLAQKALKLSQEEAS